jgi:TPR repeat protein
MNELEQAIDDWKHGRYEACFPVIQRHAELGDAEAQFVLASALSSKFSGLNEDIPAAAAWFRKACYNGHPHAALHLALVLDPTNTLYEDKLPQSTEEAAKFYKIAFEEYSHRAAQGSYEFMYGLMNCYSSGWGTEVNLEEARKLHDRLSAEGYNPYTNRCDKMQA